MQNKLPLIGVVPLWDADKVSLWMIPSYMEGISMSGALPVMLPLVTDAYMISDIISRFDGFLLTGGQDISPLLYGEPIRPVCDEICENRDKMEDLLIRAAISADKPLFGICRGMQFLNVVLGGALYQDIPTEFPSKLQHSQKPPYDLPVHSVAVTGYLRNLLGAEKIEVNSYHHQGVKKLSPQLEIGATASDGLIEAVYMPANHFVLAVQWHPEFALQWPSSQKLFSAFVQACRE